MEKKASSTPWRRGLGVKFIQGTVLHPKHCRTHADIIIIIVIIAISIHILVLILIIFATLSIIILIITNITITIIVSVIIIINIISKLLEYLVVPLTPKPPNPFINPGRPFKPPCRTC